MVAPADDAATGFLARWGRRKALARAGQPLPPEPSVAPSESPQAQPTQSGPPASLQTAIESQVPQAVPAGADVAAPSWADVAELKADSDYTRFMAPEVDLGVQRAAMKKLFFSDPHFNVMDGLDTYIDDYSQADPIPLTMLRQLNQSQALQLFAQDPAAPMPVAYPALGVQPELQGPGEAACAPAEVCAEPTPPLLTPTPAIETSSQPDDDHPDLQLQQDPATGRPGATKSPGA